MVQGVSHLLPASGTGDAQPHNATQAATQFEALLIGQMLKGAHDQDSEGWLGAGDDEAGSSMVQMAEEHMAQVLASQGGLGLAKLIAKGLERADAAPAPGAS